jgi:murein DD-endopeptidase MepM/ murein hydrolase activator NlpD
VRHRRPRKPLVSSATLLGTALGASLVAGVALGTAAASASNSHRRPAAETAATTATAGADPAPAGAVSNPARKVQPAPVAIGGRLSGDAVREKPRPLATVATRKTPSWVDPNPTAVVTSCFGQRWGRLHAGVDLAAPDGTPIVAAGAGIVVRAGVAEGYGNAVLIDHGNDFLTHYGHLSAITVTVGQHVTAGEQIGNEGSTGHSTGPHLHFEVHQGHYQNPIEPTAWMHQHGVDIPGCVPL